MSPRPLSIAYGRPRGSTRSTVDGAALPDGSYNVVVTARTRRRESSAQKVIPLSVNRALGLVTVALRSRSRRTRDGRKDRLTLTFALAAPANVRIRIEREGRWVASPLLASFRAGRSASSGTAARGTGCCATGSTTAVVEATARPGRSRSACRSLVDSTAPRVRVLPGRALRVEVSEPSMLTLVVDGQALKRDVKNAPESSASRGPGRATPRACRCLGCGRQLERAGGSLEPRLGRREAASRLAPCRPRRTVREGRHRVDPSAPRSVPSDRRGAELEAGDRVVAPGP